MDYLTQSTLRQLLHETDGLCVSITLPTHRIWAEDPQADSLRFKNLLNDARKQLPEHLDERLTAAIEQAEALRENEDFWKHQGEGLAVFIGQGGLRTFRLTRPVAESVQVDGAFAISPLLPALRTEERFYVLALTQGSARLMEGDSHQLTDVTPAAMPRDLDSALWYMEEEKLLRNRSSAGGAGNFHGEGDDTREPHAYIREYALKVDQVVREFFNNHEGPLVVLATDPILGVFNKICNYPHLAGTVAINPVSLSMKEIQAKAWECVADHFDRPTTQVLHAYGYYAAHEPSRTVTDPDEILAAARTGRVESLLIAELPATAAAAGFLERVPHTTADQDEDTAAVREAATQETLRTSGAVWLVPLEQMPDEAEMAAVLRY